MRWWIMAETKWASAANVLVTPLRRLSEHPLAAARHSSNCPLALRRFYFRLEHQQLGPPLRVARPGFGGPRQGARQLARLPVPARLRCGPSRATCSSRSISVRSAATPARRPRAAPARGRTGRGPRGRPTPAWPGGRRRAARGRPPAAARRLVMPGQSRAEPFALRRVGPGLPVQAARHGAMPRARSTGSSWS